MLEGAKVPSCQAHEVRHGRGRCVEHGLLHHAIAALLWVEVWGVRGEPLDAHVLRVSLQPCGDGLGTVRPKAVPDDDERASDASMEVPQCGDDVLVVDSADEVARKNPGVFPPPRGRQQHDAGNLTVFAQTLEDSDLSHRRPGGAQAGPKRVTRLIQKGNRPPASSSPFLMRGQSLRTQASMSASFRSRAWERGRCAENPSRCRGLDKERGW